MSGLFWSALLQWSRFGLNAVVFLFAARVLSLEQFGAFATGFALIKLTQGIHKAGVSDTVVIKAATPLRLHALFGLALIFGLLVSALFLLMTILLELSSSLLALGLIPPLHGMSAVSDGLLRKRLNIRALAVRTAVTQSIAATVALVALHNGSGVAALVIFAVLNTTLTALLSIFLAGWVPKTIPKRRHIRLTFKTVMNISGRDFFNSGVLPLAQITIGLFVGLPSAGAFQIATRVLSMLDTLTLAPLRYLALPKFASLKNTQRFNSEIHRCLNLSTIFGCWVWFGLASSTSQLLGFIVGNTEALVIAPILQALIPLGLGTAFTMTFTQALMARGLTQLVLSRAIWTFGLSVAFTIPLSQHSAINVAIALSSAHLLVSVWFVKSALLKLSIRTDIFMPVIPAALAGTVMMLVISAITVSLAGKFILGTATYFLVIGLFQFRPRTNSTV